MLLQASSPRPVFNLAEAPPFIRIQTLRKTAVSDGVVKLVSNPNSSPIQAEVPPYMVYPIQGEDGFELLDHYLPFEAVFQPVAGKVSGQQQMDKYGASRIVPIKAAPLAAAGFLVTVRSAFRADRAAYEERTTAFSLIFPVTGGGIIRLADSIFDLANPTFDPSASLPKPMRDEGLALAIGRTHLVLEPAQSASIERRRQARIADAERNISMGRPLLEEKKD